KGFGNNICKYSYNKDQGRKAEKNEKLFPFFADIILNNDPYRLTVISHGGDDASQIMYRPKKNTTNQYPDNSRHPAKSDGNNGPHYRPCTCYGGKMMS